MRKCVVQESGCNFHGISKDVTNYVRQGGSEHCRSNSATLSGDIRRNLLLPLLPLRELPGGWVTTRLCCRNAESAEAACKGNLWSSACAWQHQELQVGEQGVDFSYLGRDDAEGKQSSSCSHVLGLLWAANSGGKQKPPQLAIHTHIWR